MHSLQLFNICRSRGQAPGNAATTASNEINPLDFPKVDVWLQDGSLLGHF